jgi:branched-chain amino acid transport system ATP-binding protein
MSGKRAERRLVVSDLVAGYGRSDVLHGVSIEVGAGEAVAVLGANGAGKSTLMRAVAGFVHPRGGDVTLDGRSLRRTSASARVRRGLVLVAEGHEVVGSLTVAENLALGAFRFWPLHSRRVIRETESLAYELFPVLAERRGQLASLLSGGQQQMLAIARALMAKPSVLLLDEPSLGLAPVVVDQIYDRLGELRTAELSIVLVEQNSDRAAAFCDRTYVLRLGEIAAVGGPGTLSEQDLRQAYFGVG